MLNNYLLTAYRSLLRNKLYAVINISGLTLGIASSLLIALYVLHEWSYDSFINGYQNLYRVTVTTKTPQQTKRYAVTHSMLAPVLKDNFPEVIKTGRLHRLYFHPEMMVVVNGRSFAETRMLLADDQFTDLFGLEFIEGNPSQALATKTDVIITESTARRYFQDDQALGKKLKLDFGRELTVTGVVKDWPSTSHLNFDLLASLHFMNYVGNTMKQPDWTALQLCTYIQLQEGTDVDQFEAKLVPLLKSLAEEQVISTLGAESSLQFAIQPVSDIHLHSDLEAELKANSDISLIYLLVALAILILLISCINFINLSTARSGERAKEVGIRKVIGSGKWLLRSQFLTESTITCLISALLGLLLVLLVLPSFNQLVSRELTLSSLIELKFMIGAILFVFVLGILAGWYPATVLSSIVPSRVLKGSFQRSKKGTLLRNGMVVFQFFISITLIIGTLLTGRQMNYLKNKNLGFDQENILLIKHPLSLGQQEEIKREGFADGFSRLGLAVIENANRKIETFKGELRSIEAVTEVGGVFQMMGNRFSSTVVTPLNTTTGAERIAANFQTMDNDFLQTMDIELINGRYFSSAFNESQNVIINETMSRVLGFDDPIGKQIEVSISGDTHFRIVGVVKDYNFQSLHNAIGPLVIVNGIGAPTYFPTALAVKLKPGPPDEAIETISNKWSEFVSSEKMVWSFLGQDLNLMYRDDLASFDVFRWFTFLAIVLACTGLFALTSYAAQQRTKEIGIRKVLGAAPFSITLLLSKNFAVLIFIAYLIALPAAYYTMSYWLEGFAYRVEIGVLPFLMALLISSGFAVITISYQSIKAAFANPLESLRTE